MRTSAIPFPSMWAASVTTLAPLGTIDPGSGIHTDTCGGIINETAPACQSGNCDFTDRVSGAGVDTGVNVSASTGGLVQVLACTPTPTNTPIPSPTHSPLTVVFSPDYPARKQNGANGNMFVQVQVTYLGQPVNDAVVTIMNTQYAGQQLIYIPGSAGLYGESFECWARPTTADTFITVQVAKLYYGATLISDWTDSQPSTTQCP